ncbi:zinc-dependent metalloprotease family protein [Verrucomicrobiota bacterium]
MIKRTLLSHCASVSSACCLLILLASTVRGIEPLVIDYMVLYTPAAETLAGGEAAISNRIYSGVTNVNAALSNSGLDHITYRLVHVQKLSGNNSSIDLAEAITEIFQLDPIYEIRDTYRADSVSILVERLSVGAWATIPLSARQARQSFSYFGVQNYGGLTTAHELGHNMGGYHNNTEPEELQNLSNLVPYGYNFIGSNGVHYKTIMSTNFYSPFDPAGTNRLVNCGHYSNPLISYQETPTGKAGYADMAATITNWTPLIAGTYGDTNSPPDPDPVTGPLIKANGSSGAVIVNNSETVSISVEIDPGQYNGTNADWWVVAFTRSGQWYYLNSSMEWTEFNGDLALCQPVYQGELFNLPSTTVLNRFILSRGTYDFWFAVDYSMDGVLNYPDGQYQSDMVTVLVE